MCKRLYPSSIRFGVWVLYPFSSNIASRTKNKPQDGVKAQEDEVTRAEGA